MTKSAASRRRATARAMKEAAKAAPPPADPIIESVEEETPSPKPTPKEEVQVVVSEIETIIATTPKKKKKSTVAPKSNPKDPKVDSQITGKMESLSIASAPKPVAGQPQAPETPKLTTTPPKAVAAPAPAPVAMSWAKLAEPVKSPWAQVATGPAPVNYAKMVAASTKTNNDMKGPAGHGSSAEPMPKVKELAPAKPAPVQQLFTSDGMPIDATAMMRRPEWDRLGPGC